MSKKRFTIGADFELEETEKPKKDVESVYSNFLIAKYLSVGYYVLVPLLLGVFVGLALDKWLHTKPTFTILGIIAGVVSAFYHLWKIAKNNF